jgi:UDPglucose 6-dehydrogenase
MKVAVVGLWHLGTVTAVCLASAGHDVIGVDFDPAVVDRLGRGQPPVFEPGLDRLLQDGLSAGRLRFSTDAAAVTDADVVWIAYDTPVDDDDRADVEYVVDRTLHLFPHLGDGALVLVSSQLPVGTTRRLEGAFAGVAGLRRVAFACSPENLRLGKAIEVFTRPDRVVVGAREARDREVIAALLAPITDRIEWMSVESAEMTKHALNAFLAASIAFTNEIASLCEQVGANAAEVQRGLTSDARIGPGAYLSPGGAFAGGTLARDVVGLSQLGRIHGVSTDVLSAIKSSNDGHRRWAHRRLSQILDGVAGRRVAVWGLTYKPGTDTLRRSSSLELCQALVSAGATVSAHDPAVRWLPEHFAADVRLAAGPLDALTGASALVVATPWPDYRNIPSDDVVARMERPVVLDASRFLGETLGNDPRVRYFSVGRVTP